MQPKVGMICRLFAIATNYKLFLKNFGELEKAGSPKILVDHDDRDSILSKILFEFKR